MSWATVKLDTLKADVRYSCVGGPFGSNLTSKDYVDQGVPVIRGQNLSGAGWFNEADFVFVSQDKANQLRPNQAFRGDLIFTQRGTLGQVGLIPASSKFDCYIVSQSQMKLTVDPAKVDARFLYFYFRLATTIEQILNRTITAGVPHINLGILKDFDIPLPPLSVQTAIADFAQSYDDLIETNRRRIALLEESARLLYREWFTERRVPPSGTLPPGCVPSIGWRETTFGNVVEAIGGATPSTDRPAFWDGDIVWLTPSDVTRNDCLFLPTSGRKITTLGYDSCSTTLLDPGTIFMSSRASIGYFALLDQPACTNQGFIAVVPKIKNSRNFFLFHLMSRVEEFEQKATGSTFKELSKKAFKEMQLALPPEELLARFEEKTQPFIAQIITLKKQNCALAQARDQLLPKLMSGELRP